MLSKSEFKILLILIILYVFSIETNGQQKSKSSEKHFPKAEIRMDKY